MLTGEIKGEIQEAYRAWLASRQFKPRRGQREMIAHIARTLAGDAPRVAVVEAGTGTGKTAAYCIASIPIAKALGKTIVLSTATVALQEQVTFRDLPDLKSHSELQFNFELAKGRGRYVCLKRLDDRLRYADKQEVPLFDWDDGDDSGLFQSMLTRFGDGSWNGELDTLEDGVDPEAWRSVTTDHRSCTNKRCGFFRQCPFFRARSRLEGTDVIIANHDLVLADLSLGGGAVLPEPDECIYIFDEAHHLPEKTQQHFSSNMRLKATAAWTDTATSVVGSLVQRFARPGSLVALATTISVDATALSERLQNLSDSASLIDYVARDDTLATHRFAMGQVPQDVAEAAQAALPHIEQISMALESMRELLQKAVEGELNWDNAFEAEDWLPAVGQLQGRAAATQDLLTDYAQANDSTARFARWANRHESERFDTDIELVSAPIDPGTILQSTLWDVGFAAVCTSATLTALGNFSRFYERSGLDEVEGMSAGVRIPSPFDFPNIATLTVPSMESDPRDAQAHTDEVAAMLPGLLAQERSGLVLFTSWRQMREVTNLLPQALVAQMHIQGEASKQALLDAHREVIDGGGRSYLVGLASFAEGVDLPDDYCRHVVIVKLPFSVPDDPLDQALAEWAEAQGRNPFMDISVPDAAVKLVQACGRLIRHEGDFGRITLLDRRIVTKRYGQALLDSLPPFRRDLQP